MSGEYSTNDERVLVLAPTSADRSLSKTVLTDAEIDCHLCHDLSDLTDRLCLGAGAILLTEEILAVSDANSLVEILSEQPPWSDLPIILLSASGEESPIAAWSMERLGNVTVLERPVRLTTLVSALRAAIRARRRQYELRDQIEALSRSEQQLRLVTDSLPAVVTYIDGDGQYRFHNRTLSDWFGLDSSEVIGRKVAEVLGEKAYQSVRPMMERAFRGETVHFEADMPYERGGERAVEVCYAPDIRADGSVEGFVGLIHDVSERRRAASALSESEARLRQLISLMPMAVYTCDAEGRITFFNKQAAALWGRSPTIGDEDEKFCGSFRLWKPDGSPVLHCETPMAAAIANGTSCRNVPVVVERPDGTRITVSVNIDPLNGSEGERLGAINVFEDVTERVQAVEALKQADRRKDEFLAMLAHELRNPLAPIRTGIQVIQLCGDDRETAAATIAMMDRQVVQLVRLIDDLLDISRITRGKIQLRSEECELGPILSSAIESSRPLIEEAGLELTVSTPRRRVELLADPTRLAQVVSNLLTNSAKYTDRGGHIWLTAEQHDEEVIISVRDTGIGIRPEQLTQVFDMFTQVDKTNRSHAGLGIGLSLVKALVELHGGTVEARSEGLGKGSEFIVRLPIAVVRGRFIEKPMLRPSEESSGGYRVLVVDDNRAAAQTLSMILEFMGNEIRIAYDGLEGLAAAEEFRPDLALIDLGMPNLNGLETAKRIRQQPWGENMILVALTGWGQEEDRRRSKAAGFDRHLTKPVDSDTLKQLLNEIPVWKPATI